MQHLQARATCAIAVMAKASSPGRTKTRLAPPLSLAEAAQLNTSFLKDIAANIRQAAQETSLTSYMAFGPPGSESFFRAEMSSDVELIETWLGDFGACLFFAIEALFARGHLAACVLNSDSPTLPASILVDMAAALAEPGDRVVIGPADDGGYYALGLKVPHRRLFEDIAWSTGAVFEQTLARAAEIGLPVRLLPGWFDVDDAASLGRLCRDLFQPQPSAADARTPGAADHTRRLLVHLREHEGLQTRLEAVSVEVG